MKTVNYLVTDKNLSINFDNKTFVISSSEKDKYDNLLGLIRTEDEEAIKSFLVPKDAIIRYANEYFLVTDAGKLYMKDMPREELPFIIANRLMDMLTHKLPLNPLVKFWLNLRQNPTESSRQSLYTFLEKHNQPITEEGNFIAYKKVTSTDGKLMDSHTRTMDNSVGKIVKMDRSKVDADITVSCSTGLHVASLNYAKNFSGDVLIVVVVNPRDVVAVPKGEDDKMRVCEYKVVGLYEDPAVQHTDKNYDSKAILAKIPNDVKFDTAVIEKFTDIDGFKKEIYDAQQTKEVSFYDKTAKELLVLTEGLTGEKIGLSIKNKDGILIKAAKILTKFGFKIK